MKDGTKIIITLVSNMFKFTCLSTILAFVAIANGFSCAPQEPVTLKQQFYKSWAVDEPFSEITVLEKFEEIEYMMMDTKESTPNDMITNYAVVRVNKVYTGCAAQTPYYTLLKDKHLRYIPSTVQGLTKGHSYITPLKDIVKSGENAIQSLAVCTGYTRDVNTLSKEEIDFLEGRMSCCNGTCTCLGAGRVMSQCGSNQCVSQAPCPNAISCRVNPCDTCKEEWFAENWQVPC